jgi:hypothetical protein
MEGKVICFVALLGLAACAASCGSNLEFFSVNNQNIASEKGRDAYSKIVEQIYESMECSLDEPAAKWKDSDWKSFSTFQSWKYDVASNSEFKMTSYEDPSFATSQVNMFVALGFNKSSNMRHQSYFAIEFVSADPPEYSDPETHEYGTSTSPDFVAYQFSFAVKKPGFVTKGSSAPVVKFASKASVFSLLVGPAVMADVTGSSLQFQWDFYPNGKHVFNVLKATKVSKSTSTFGIRAGYFSYNIGALENCLSFNGRSYGDDGKNAVWNIPAGTSVASRNLQAAPAVSERDPTCYMRPNPSGEWSIPSGLESSVLWNDLQSVSQCQTAKEKYYDTLSNPTDLTLGQTSSFIPADKKFNMNSIGGVAGDFASNAKVLWTNSRLSVSFEGKDWRVDWNLALVAGTWSSMTPLTVYRDDQVFTVANKHPLTFEGTNSSVSIQWDFHTDCSSVFSVVDPTNLIDAPKVKISYSYQGLMQNGPGNGIYLSGGLVHNEHDYLTGAAWGFEDGDSIVMFATPVPPTEEPTTEEPTDPPTDPPTEEPTDPPTEEPTDPPTEEPTDPPTEEPTDPTDEPTDATDKPTDPTDEPTDPTDEPTDKPTDPTDEPTDATDKPTDPSTDEPTDPSTDKPTDPSTDKPTDAPTGTPSTGDPGIPLTDGPTIIIPGPNTTAPTANGTVGGTQPTTSKSVASMWSASIALVLISMCAIWN